MARTVKKADERRREILAAARTLFQTRAYDQTTMQDIMKALNIAKGTIYHYFPSKEALLQAVIEDLVEGQVTRLETLTREADFRNLPVLEKLQQLMAAGMMADQQEELLSLLHRPDNSQMHIRQLGNMISRLAPVYAEIIREGCKTGLFTTDHPLESAELLLSGIQFLTDMGIYPWTPEQLQRRAAAFPALVEAQLNAPEGSFRFLQGDPRSS